MQDQIRRVLLGSLGALSLFASGCVHETPPQLVSDPATTGKRESALPWNEQTSWERNGPYGAMLGEQGPRP